MDDFKFPYDVKGWLSEDEGLKLAEIAVDKTVLEIGAYCGRSTICLAQTARLVVSLDTWDGRATPDPRPTLDEWMDNCWRHFVWPKCIPIKHREQCGTFDLVFIDADHSEEMVRADLEFAIRCLNSGGLLAFHDYNPGNMHCGVTVAVDEYLASGAKLLSLTGSLAVVEPAAKGNT